MNFDLILAGGAVVDGSGGPPCSLDLGLVGERIEAVGDLASAQAEERLDIAGLVVTPGFIDVHTHSDLAPFLPEDELELRRASLRQGVTTEICGNCGFSPFPARPERIESVDRHLQPLFGGDARGYATLGEFASSLSEAELITNLGMLTGHGTLRAGVMGLDDRAPSAGEMREMVRALDQTFEEGSFGLSSGLIYAPGVYAETSELIELARVAARRDRVYTTHLRDEFDDVQDAIDEALTIGRESGAFVEISHHKVAGRRNWGRSEATLASIEQARMSGVNVGIDVYPYTAGSTMLSALLPPWVNEGGPSDLLPRLHDPSVRRRLDAELSEGLPGWQNIVASAGWDGVVVAAAPRNPGFEGKSIADLSEESDMTPSSFVYDLLADEDARVTVVIHMMDEADVQQITASPLSIIGSDGLPLPGKPHPRWAGTFVRVLGRYVRETSLLSLEQAIRKMTSLPAERFGLRDRGTLARGKKADLVVFDPATVSDGATYESPLDRPAGVVHVLVNGVFAVRDAGVTGRYAGHVISPG